MKIEYKDNSPAMMQFYVKLIEKALLQVALQWQRNVTPFVPVDTGKLRQSMHYEVDIAKKIVRVGSTVKDPPYSIFQELGTGRMPAQPYLTPSIMNYRKEYEQAFKDVFGGEWKLLFM